MKKLILMILWMALPLTGRGEPVDCVDLMMGVRGNSNCVVGPQLPHGSVNPAPQTRHGGQNGYKENEPIRGFAQLHVSGIGWTRYGQLLLSPQTGFAPGEADHDSEKQDEVATPYYYKVRLSRYDITTELAPTHHAVAYRFTYPRRGDKTLLLDMRHSLAEHIVPEVHGRFITGELQYDAPSHTLTGWGEYAGGFGSGDPYRVYFAMTINDAQARVTLSPADSLYARIDVRQRRLCVNIGVSMRSIDNALRYLNEEVAGRSLEEVAQEARRAWNAVLSRITVGGDKGHVYGLSRDGEEGASEELRLFYTALYHSLLMPRDRTGDNPRWDSTEPHIDDHYCIWDTWRTCYPLLTLIEPDFVARTIRSFIDRLRHDGQCTPTFTSSLEFDNKQGGDDVDNVIADAIVKNVGGFDRREAYEVMLHNARHARQEEYLRQGWISARHPMMCCSYTMEYAYNDFCLARVAQLMGDKAIHLKMLWRSAQWERLFNPSLESHGFRGFIGPRRPGTADADSAWITIDPAFAYASWVDYFYEGNSWVYTLFVPGQEERLIELCGGPEEMVRRLQYGFDHGLIDLSNEPGFLSPFLFHHCHRPDLTAHYVQRLRQTAFSIAGGYPDNEDSGAMGSWYVLASLGLFPCAGQDFYYLVPPAFGQASMRLGNGNELVIRSHRRADGPEFPTRVELNGHPLDGWTVRHEQIAQGGVLEFFY